MLKAGEAAMSASASAEALDYYQKALELYLSKSGEAVDHDKMSMLEKNIAQAYHNRGLYIEAIEHFKKAMIWMGERIPTGNLPLYIKAFLGFLFMIREYYLWPRKGKSPGKRDELFFELIEKLNSCYVVVDSTVFMLMILFLHYRLIGFRFNEFTIGYYAFKITNSFSVIGFIGLSKKILRTYRDKIKREDEVSVFYYHHAETQHGLYTGDWDIEIKNETIDHIVGLGHIQWASYQFTYQGYIYIEKGDFSVARDSMNKLVELADSYENEDAWVCRHELASKLHLKKDEYREALEATEKGIELSRNTGQSMMLIYFMGTKANIQVYLDDTDEAETTIEETEELIRKEGFVPPHFSCRYRIAVARFHLRKLEDGLWNGQSPRSGAGSRIALKRKARKAIKKARNMSKKYIADRTEAQRMMGTYCRLLGKKRRAFMWWGKSIETAEKLGAKLELSRTFFEIGKQLTEEDRRVKEHSGKGPRMVEFKGESPEHYLKKAEELFRELQLSYDLEQLERLRLR
jgi:tetratricopeptide (TPR) repeat protein